MNLVNVEGLTKLFRAPGKSWWTPRFFRPWLRALHDVSFQIAAGESVALLGENGSGKSTLLRLIAGILLPDDGKIQIGSADARPPRLSYLPADDRALVWSLTVRQNFKFFSLIYGLPAQAAASEISDLTQRLGLSSLLDVSVGQLSTGYRRRTALARCLLGRPQLLLLDEPTRGLDRQSKADLLALLSTLRSEGMTMVLATHHLEEAQKLCSRGLLLERGKLVRADAIEKLV